MYKKYTVSLKNGKKYYLLAKHNREAMQLTGKFSKWCGEVLALEDEEGKIVVDNSEF